MQADKIYLGLTRQPMLFGVPFYFALWNIVATLVLFLNYGLLSFILGFIVHTIFYSLSIYDPYYLDILLIKYFYLFFRRDILLTKKKKYYS